MESVERALRIWARTLSVQKLRMNFWLLLNPEAMILQHPSLDFQD